MIKKLRLKFNELKEIYLNHEYSSCTKVYIIVNIIFIIFTSIIIIFVGSVFYGNNLNFISYLIALLAISYEIVSLVYTKAFIFNLRISSRILDSLFGKYGHVVTKNDWKRIKKENKSHYKYLNSKKSLFQCYNCSRYIALFLQDAQLMYCSQELSDGRFGAHSVILKGNYVYDTNKRMHYTLYDFIKAFDVTIYKTFSYEEYKDENFFHNIKEDWTSWCKQNNVSVKFLNN